MNKIFRKNLQCSVKANSIRLTGLLILLAILQGCAAVNTFPTVARAGDTVSVMVGGSEKARKETTTVILTDFDGVQWDLNAQGLVRSLFILRTDARSNGMQYSPYLDIYNSWIRGHEPVQTVLVVDIPTAAAIGNAVLTINNNVTDDSSGVASPYTVNIDIIPGAGSINTFLRNTAVEGYLPVDFARLEPAPHAKISFGIYEGIIIGATSLVIDFDETVVNPDDINVYVPESTLRGTVSVPGKFGETQRMVHWRHDGQQLYVDIIAPQGLNNMFLKLYIMHPRGLPGLANFSMTSSVVYDVNGNEIVLSPTLEYFQ